jgi:hypothetical protein
MEKGKKKPKIPHKVSRKIEAENRLKLKGKQICSANYFKSKRKYPEINSTTIF